MEPSKNDIIDAFARGRTVERLVENITRRPLDALGKDLAQTVYAVLLDYDEGKIQDLHRCGQLSYFAVRIIMNQYRSRTSPFWNQTRKFSARSVDIEGHDFADGK